MILEDRLAQFVPAPVEQVHVMNLVDPFLGGMVRGVSTTGGVVDEERLLWIDLVDLVDVIDGFVSHGRGEIPARFSLEGVDLRRVTKEVGLPLVRVTADEAEEVIKTMPRAIGRRVRSDWPRRRGCYDFCRTMKWRSHDL